MSTIVYNEWRSFFLPLFWWVRKKTCFLLFLVLLNYCANSSTVPQNMTPLTSSVTACQHPRRSPKQHTPTENFRKVIGTQNWHPVPQHMDGLLMWYPWASVVLKVLYSRIEQRESQFSPWWSPQVAVGCLERIEGGGGGNCVWIQCELIKRTKMLNTM